MFRYWILVLVFLATPVAGQGCLPRNDPGSNLRFWQEAGAGDMVRCFGDNPNSLFDDGKGNHPDYTAGRTPLHAVADNRNSAELVNALVALGADVNARDEFGFTPLHGASTFGNFNAAKALIAAGADIHARTTKFGWTPLYLAAQNDTAKNVQALLDAGAGSDINVPSYRDGKTPLHKAAAQSEAETVKALLAAGADVHAQDSIGYTPLHRAAAQGKAETVKALLEAGSDIHARTRRGLTPAEIARRMKRCAEIRILCVRR